MLTSAAQDLLERSVAWMDRYWDAACGLLWDMGDAGRGEALLAGSAAAHVGASDGMTTAGTELPGSASPPHGDYHIVRESAWYALGLLMRNRVGDAGRAMRALETILTYQFDQPDQIYHGTFYRAPEEPHPPEQAIIWKHYDPNWREFIITTLAVILTKFEDRLPRPLVEKIDVAIRKAVAGARARSLAARYTNIALMDAQMLVWAGDRLGERGWVEAGEAMGREVYRLFKQHDAFAEYNSPTYYGPDIYALGLWQLYCSSPQLQWMAAEMEELLWRDIARFYHAGLRNMAGPYDRSYGMDMCRYVALLGAWIWLITGRENAPFPDVSGSFAHAADFCFGPLIAILGPRVPVDVVPHFMAFQGERCVERVISDSPNPGVTGCRRMATAWLGEKAMIGAEYTSLSDIGQGQFHPATIHWRLPQREAGQADVGRVGWVRLMTAQPVDAVASPYRLVVVGRGVLAFLLDAPGLQTALVKPDYWQLPGLEVRVATAAPGVVEDAGEQVLVRYAGAIGQELRIVLDLSVECRPVSGGSQTYQKPC